MEKLRQLTKRKVAAVGALGAIGAGLLTGCGGEPERGVSLDQAVEKVLQEKGVAGQIELADVRKVREFRQEGKIDGSGSGFLLFGTGAVGGSVEGNMKGGPVSTVIFAWKNKQNGSEYIMSSEIVSDKTRIKIVDDANAQPKVEFSLDKEKFVTRGWGTSDRFDGVPCETVKFVDPTCAEPAEGLENVNDYLKGDKLKMATFYLTQKQYDALNVPKS